MSYLPLKAARKANIPIRIAHSHNTAIDRDFKYLLKTYFRFKLPKVANYYCACGKEAGEFLFPGKEYMYVPNAIEIDRFLFNENVRMKKRRELGIKDEIVIGHIGRMSYQKNHKYLIDVFAEILKNDYVLTFSAIDAIRDFLYEKHFATSIQSKIYKKELFNDVEFPVGKRYEDLYTLYRLVSKCNTVS